jgi:hypothetical protein
VKLAVKKRKLSKEGLRELKARNLLFQGLEFFTIYFCLNILAIYSILSGVAVIEAIILLLCSPIPWFFSALSYIAGFLFSRGVHSKLVAELLIASGVASFVIGSALLITFNFSLASLPNMLVHQLETGALGFWSFLLGILGFILLAVIEKIGLLYMFAVISIVTGVALILMGIRRRLKLEVY